MYRLDNDDAASHSLLIDVHAGSATLSVHPFVFLSCTTNGEHLGENVSNESMSWVAGEEISDM